MAATTAHKNIHKLSFIHSDKLNEYSAIEILFKPIKWNRTRKYAQTHRDQPPPLQELPVRVRSYLFSYSEILWILLNRNVYEHERFNVWKWDLSISASSFRSVYATVFILGSALAFTLFFTQQFSKKYWSHNSTQRSWIHWKRKKRNKT